MSLTTPAPTSEIASRNGHASRQLTLGSGKVEALGKGAALDELSDAQWSDWARHLQKRKTPKFPKRIGKQACESLGWGLGTQRISEDTRELLTRLATAADTKSSKRKFDPATAVKVWLAEHESDAVDVDMAIECLAWAHALSQLADRIPAEQWCELLLALLVVAEQAAGIDVEHSPLLHQLLAGELAWTLAANFPEVDACRKQAKPARMSLSHGVKSLLDGEGEIDASHLADARALLACWTRCGLLGEAMDKPALRGEAATVYDAFIRQTLATMRAGGGQMLNDDAAWEPNLLEAALSICGSDIEQKIAKILLPRGKKSEAKSLSKNRRKRLGEPSTHSEWASSALLRASWQADAPRVLLDYSGPALRSEFFAGHHVLLSGECSPRIHIDGQLHSSDLAWEEICWHCDEDVVYVEIEADLAEGWKCQRQFVLDRAEQVLLVADAIVGESDADIQYECNWPVGDSVKVIPEAETTECGLAAGKKTIAHVLPLALPEWKCDGRRSGSLEAGDDGLRYSLQRQTKRLYAPLLFDVDAARMKYPYTWRHLTVAQNLQPTPREEAVAYRVQLRLDQWLIYRSLAPVASRTVLGQNYYYEFVCGRFERSGEVETLIEVE